MPRRDAHLQLSVHAIKFHLAAVYTSSGSATGRRPRWRDLRSSNGSPQPAPEGADVDFRLYARRPLALQVHRRRWRSAGGPGDAVRASRQLTRASSTVHPQLWSAKIATAGHTAADSRRTSTRAAVGGDPPTRRRSPSTGSSRSSIRRGSPRWPSIYSELITSDPVRRLMRTGRCVGAEITRHAAGNEQSRRCCRFIDVGVAQASADAAVRRRTRSGAELSTSGIGSGSTTCRRPTASIVQQVAAASPCRDLPPALEDDADRDLHGGHVRHGGPRLHSRERKAAARDARSRGRDATTSTERRRTA